MGECLWGQLSWSSGGDILEGSLNLERQDLTVGSIENCPHPTVHAMSGTLLPLMTPTLWHIYFHYFTWHLYMHELCLHGHYSLSPSVFVSL